MMRRLFAAGLFVLLNAAAAAAQPAVFLVRHAERADAATSGPTMMANDPELSGAGTRRAQSLAKMLEDAGIAAIFTTEYKRTKQTAAPLATALGVVPTVVASKDMPDLVRKIKAATGNVLVVGHSNTIPDVLKQLGISDPITIAEAEFDNLFIVVRGSLVRLRY
jgi:broad specificity phosphatase PhoE